MNIKLLWFLTNAHNSFHQNHLWVIDVSQSVEQDHPHAFDFLRSDIKNIDEFFSRRNVPTLGVRATFDIITTPWGKDGGETEEHIAKEVERLLSNPKALDDQGQEVDRAQNDAIFAQSYIPRQLDEVYDAERDVAKITSGQGGDLIYASTTGIASSRPQQPMPTSLLAKNVATAESEDSTDSEEGDSDSEGSEDDESRFDKVPKGKKFEDKSDKKERKQAVKDEKKEKRKTKMKKGEKKRKVAKTSGKR